MSPVDPSRLAEPPHVDQVLAEYMQSLDRGERIDRARFLTEHPELAGELQAYFADCDGIAEFTDGAGLSYASPVTPLLPPGSDDSPFGFPPLGDCEIIEELAQGGMGIVYKARQYVGAGSPRPYRLVALKMMRGGRFTSPAEIRRFESEVEAVAHLDHPNIVPIHEVGQYEGRYWFSMKLVEGGSLAQHFASFRLPLPGEENSPGLVVQRHAALVEMIATVARAVHYAHQRGIIHRDLKPANILLDEQNQPHVADFGLARRVPLDAEALRDAESRLTQSGLIIGTPNYMAPEQARAHKTLSTAADTYSLGAILYELLTGQPPFREATPLATLVKVLDHEPKPPRALNPLVDHDLETICLKCLRKESEERYGSAAALADDLDRWRRGEPIHARPVGTVERTVKWVRRRPALAGMILLSVVSVLGGFGTALWQWRLAEGALQERDFSDYVRGIGLTRHERLANMSRAREHLNDCPQRYRGWEWHYLDRICHSELRTLEGHRGAVIAVAIHPQGNEAASAGQDGKVIFWNPRTGERLREITAHATGILHLAYSPDGNLLATAAANGEIKLLDANTGAERHTMQGHQKAVTCVAFHPEGQTLFSTGEDGALRMWNVATGKLTNTLAQVEGVLSGVAVHRDGNRVAVSGWDGHVRIWDVARGEEVFCTPPRRWRWTSVAFSPDGELLAATGDQGHVQAWHVASGQDRFRVRGPTQRMHQAAFSPDGRRLAVTAEDGSVQVWDLTRAEEELFLTLRGHTRRANGLAYSPDGRLLLSCGTDGAVKVWDAVTHPEERYLGEHGIPVTALAFARSAERLVFAGADGQLRIAESASGKIERTLPALPGEVRCLAVTGNGGQIICGTSTGTVRALNSATGAVVHEWSAHSAAVYALFLSTDEEQLLTAGADGTIHRWELGTGRHVGELPSVKAKLTAAAFSPDGQQMAVAGPDLSIHLRDVITGRVRKEFEGERTRVTALAFDGHNRLAATSRDKTTRLWDVSTGREVFILARHLDPPRALAFDPRGHLLATGGDDKTVRIYDGTPRAVDRFAPSSAKR